jgi:4-hydroxy-tetrahydrodipicolinate synthase
MEHLVQGNYVALPTPFKKGRVDLECFTELIKRLANMGADGILVAGTTGEVPTLNDYEQRSLIHCAVEASCGRVSVLAGIGSNCTRSSVEMARYASSVGVDAIMAVTPYYNRPSPKGLLLHYGHVADATDLPLVLYNVPTRTGTDLLPALAGELAARHDNIVAIKETTLDMSRVHELLQSTDLVVLCGEDTLIYEYGCAGAMGAISVVSNIVPQHVSGILTGTRDRSNLSGARELQDELVSLNAGLALEVNPVPLKSALAALQLCLPEVRLPLAPLEPEARSELRRIMADSPAIYSLKASPVELE